MANVIVPRTLTLPQGARVHNVRADMGDRVTCRLGAATVYAARWAIMETEG